MTASFVRRARRARLRTDELCRAVHEAAAGLAVRLGGGVFKKRVNRNRHRAVILGKGGRRWFYIHLFAKQDQADLNEQELAAFRALARYHDELSAAQLQALLSHGDLTELNCDSS
jgi:hypothetical protein